MKPPKYKPFIDKSVSAAISSIEIYNKPDFKYREETFSILLINAWELLLKAKIIKECKGKLTSIYDYEPKIKKDGMKSKNLKIKVNRSGNPLTLGIPKCLKKISEISNLQEAVKENILLLVEIRDTAIHFQNNDLYLSKKVQEIGTASLRNYIVLINDWFSYDLSQYNFYLMPISFYHDYEALASFSINNYKKQIGNLLKYIEKKENEIPSDEQKEYNISLRLETKFVKSSSTADILMNYSNDPDAIKINLQEEDILKKYPLEYEEINRKCKEKFSDFKVNDRYHKIRQALEKNRKYCYERPFNPNNPESGGKKFYNPEILKEIGKNYKVK